MENLTGAAKERNRSIREVEAKNQNISENFGQLMASLNFHLTFSFLPPDPPHASPETHTCTWFFFFWFHSFYVAAKLDDDWPKGVQFYISLESVEKQRLLAPGSWILSSIQICVKSLLVKNGPSHRSSSGKCGRESKRLSLSWDKSDKWILHKSN